MLLMRAGLIAVLLIAVLSSGCVSMSSEDTDTTPDEMPETQPDTDNNGRQTQNNTVFYTDSGFQPQTIEIEQGETVTWLDRSSNPMWVASNRHPSHTQYDGNSLSQHCGSGEEPFDQCEPGEVFSFTFEKQGTWQYHNHKAAGDQGTVVVN